MKRHYSFLLAFLVALSSIFVSCEEDNFEDSNRCKITVTATKGGKVKISKYLGTTETVLIGSEISVVATPDEGYVFNGWYVGDSTEPISNDAEFTFVATKNATLIAHFIMPIGEAVDLGLPSRLKWATCNVGASSPEEYGGYYAWGEIEEKNDYSWSTYKWCNGSQYTLTKYCMDSNYGTVDNKTVLDPEDDVAHVKWGGTWRMPTYAELDELLNYCTWTWTTQNGVNGYKVTGYNGNSIFLPAAGCRYEAEVYDRGRLGGYWSSLGDSRCGANGIYFRSDYYLWDGDEHCSGLSVRPVCD